MRLLPHPHRIIRRRWRARHTKLDGEEHGVSDASVAPPSGLEHQSGRATQCGGVEGGEGGMLGDLRRFGYDAP